VKKARDRTYLHSDSLIEILRQISMGMKYLESKDVVHFDLKAANVLVDARSSNPNCIVVKIADFGLAKLIPKGTAIIRESVKQGTSTHLDKKAFKKGGYSSATDVFSFGRMVYEIVSHGEDVPKNTNVFKFDVARFIAAHVQLEWSEECLEKIRMLAQRCLCKASKRPTFLQICDELDSMKETTETGTGLH